MPPIKCYKHLKSYDYYSDRYDRFTIEKCRRIEKNLSNLEYKPKLKNNKKVKGKELKAKINLAPLVLYFTKGDQYLGKAETIREWMARDKALDEKLENASVPQDILCSSCGVEMELRMKDLHGDSIRDAERVLFYFRCPKCDRSKFIYENGELWKPSPDLCPKCKAEMGREHKRKGNKITTIYTCPVCDYKEKDILDLDEKPKPEPVDPNFEKDRRKFCLSSAEGQEYLGWTERFKQLKGTLKTIEEDKKNEKALARIKKLSIADLNKFLTPKLKKEAYIKLDFAKPDLVKGDVVIEFTVQDNKPGRCEYDSRIQLQRLLKRKLANTNWRLMSEGVCYRLGILSGRFRGYENKRDLIKLINKN